MRTWCSNASFFFFFFSFETDPSLGFGFEGSGHTPALVRAVTALIRNVTPGGAYIVGGAPAQWRSSEGDADRNPEFVGIWMNEFDAILPWHVNRFRTEQEADDFSEFIVKGDIELVKRHNEQGNAKKIDYIPVVFPGFSVGRSFPAVARITGTDCVNRVTISPKGDGAITMPSETAGDFCGSKFTMQNDMVRESCTAPCGTST